VSQAYVKYTQVPWYRRATIIGTITTIGLLFTPALVFSCIVALTGDVYYETTDAQGHLNRWAYHNKISAVALLIIQVVVYVMLVRAYDN
jgi:hypothetical protein